ncbi:predicted protein [Nematostella vectensis]|uniref:Uncharacterized protein n=1 Tax=Nematostella vectensis TaxID=45351 RepID=A7RKB3_NEMVE|nr:predicted protein [Nematostella vectensis]|eukprot:XP_001640201.1 predicted protein [Nematostella vectensis]
MQTLLAVVLLFCHCQTAHGVWKRTIYVSALNGSMAADCGTSIKPCKSLDFAFRQVEQGGSNSTRLVLESGSYNLTSSVSFLRVNKFALSGDGDVTINCPRSNTSLSFFVAEDIILQGFTLTNCGDWHASSVSKKDWIVDNPKFMTAVFILYCKNLLVKEVEIKSTPGVGFTGYSIAGNVGFINVNFTQNVPLQQDNSSTSPISPTGEYAKSGGGLFLLIGKANYSTFKISTDEVQKFVKGNSLYTIRDCTFLSNEAPLPDFEVNDVPSIPFSRGGGLAIFATGTSGNNSVLVDSCLFTGNKAVWGGGMLVEFQKQCQNNTVKISNSIFEKNMALTAGGALRMSTIVEENPNLVPNQYYIVDSEIIENNATWGGGLVMFGSTYLQNGDKDGIVLIKGSILARNRGTVGAAIGAFLANLNEDEIGPAVPYKLILDNCTIANNLVVMLKNNVLVGQGTIYVDEVPLQLKNKVFINNNTGTAVLLDASTLEVSGHVEFVQNVGYRGGALALYSTAKVEFKSGSSILFLENRCEEKGGALFVSSQGPPFVSFNATGFKTHKCFFTYEDEEIDYDDWNVNITFQGNGFTVKDTNPLGKAVFASSLRDCRRTGELRANNSALEWNIIRYLDKYGQRIEIKDEVATEPIDIVYNRNDWIVAPSQFFNATVKLIDEKMNQVYGIVHIDVIGDTDPEVKLKTGSSLFLSHDMVENLRITGYVGSSFSVELRTVSGTLVFKTIKGLMLQKCFPGFKQKGFNCVCSNSENDGIHNCSDDGKEVFIKKGYWAGMVGKTFTTHLCPENYCTEGYKSYGTEEIAYLYNTSTMCKGYRNISSLLCGKCKTGYTVLIGGEHCSDSCSDLYLLTLIPYAIVLFLIVMAIMAINLDFFTGYLNAWLYSYQVLTLLLNEGFSLDSFMQFIIGLANTQLKFQQEGTCLLKGIDDADKLVIMYLLPTWVLVSVVILSKCVQKKPDCCYSKHVKAPFRAFCTLFVLCYTNITSISLKILFPARIGNRTVLYQDGEVEFFQGKHIAYSLIAIFFLAVVVIPFPLTLMFTPFFTKCCRPFFNLNQVKPIYDSYQGCFKDEYRWCSAFYFVCRLFLLSIATYVQPGPTKSLILQASCMIILVVFVYLKPYKEENKWINKLDATLLTNLSLITILSSALTQVNKDQSEIYVTIIKVLAYVPLVYLVYIAIYVGYHRKDKIRAILRVRLQRRRSLENFSETDATIGRDNIEGQHMSEYASQVMGDCKESKVA